LGIELAQARVDIAFLRARAEMVQSILASLSFRMTVDDQQAPAGHAFISTEAIEHLRETLGSTTG